MPFIKRSPPSPTQTLFVRVAATIRLNHLRCNVRRCRRACRCIDKSWHGLPHCIRAMRDAEVEEMMEFVADTAALATPEMLAAHLKLAATQDERQMIAFRRDVFLYFHRTMAEAGLAEPLGPPFVEG